MRRTIVIILTAMLGSACVVAQTSTRKERLAIVAGNEAYKAKDYARALTLYKTALRDNPSSLVALFNQGLAQMQTANAMDATKKQDKEQVMNDAKSALTSVANHAVDNPSLASRANYNLGNLSYLAEDYQAAVDFYKQALRLNPDDNKARKNLRLAQLKLQQKKDDKNDKNDKQDNKDNDKKDNKQQQQPQQQPQQDKEQDKKPDQQPQQQQPQPQQGGMSQQAADRILKHSQDKEKQTLKKAMYGKERQSASSRKRW